MQNINNASFLSLIASLQYSLYPVTFLRTCRGLRNTFTADINKRGGKSSYGTKRVRNNKALFAVLKKSKALELPFDIQIELSDKTVKPILLYGAELWGYSNCDSLERIHLKFLKYLFNLKRSTPSYMIYGELGIMHISVEI